MGTQVIGEDSLSLREVAKTIEKSTTFAELLPKWRFFGEELELKDEVLEDLQLRVNLGAYKLEDVPRKILKTWKANKGTGATLEILCDALEECGLRDIADALDVKFGRTAPDKGPLFLLNEMVYTLEQLLGENISKLYQEIKKKFLSSHADKPIRLLRDEVSPRKTPEYYICRTFFVRTELDARIFKDDLTKGHVFVVKGASKSQLARMSGFQMVENSRNQLRKLTVRFIVLDREEDFEQICRISTKPTPIHMIMFINNQFFWVKSTHGVDTIQFFLKKIEIPTPFKSPELDNFDADDKLDGLFGVKDIFSTFEEKEAVKRITSLEPSSGMSIAESPGMGKTFILTKIAEEIGQTYPHSITIFIVLQELIRQTYPTNLSSSYLEYIFQYATIDHTRKSILMQMCSANSTQLYLFLDGYDEVLQEKLDFVDSMLQHLLTIRNVKIVVTTRKHLNSRLEKLFNSLSYEMLPFNQSNQIEFLTKYWTTKYGAKDGKTLTKFAKKCLKKLQMVMTKTEKNIAGVPLQCMMLAEVYAEDAKRSSELEQLPKDAVQILSFFEMYKALINLKLNRISDPLSRQKYLDAHVIDAIALLFPEWLDKFKPHLSPRDDIDENTLYSIGLLEKTPFSDVPRFVHRTFVEYVVADSITRSLTRSVIFVKFLFDEILGEMGVTLKQRVDNNEVPVQPTLYQIKHPVIAYFLNMFLQDRYPSDFSEVLNTLDLQNIKKEDLCIAANACCSNDHENCFDLTESIISRLSISDKNDLRDKYFKHLLHLVVENTNNDSFVQKVLNFTKSEFEINLTDHVFDGKFRFGNALEIPNCTPLHVAVHEGKYNVTVYLMQEYGRDVLSFRYLVHTCVHQSRSNIKSVIEDKLSILEVLTELKKEWLQEELNGITPLLQDGVHVDIVKKLVELGANINSLSTQGETVLHTVSVDDHNSSENTFSNLLRWALSNGFELVNHKAIRGDTLLMRAIEIYREVDDECLQILNEARYDFAAQDRDGNSILFYAIEHSENLHLIRKLLDFEANPNHINRHGRNAAHMIMNPFYRSNHDQVLEKLKLLKSRGFDRWDQKDDEGCTPLMLGIEKGHIIADGELLEFLHEQGVNFNAQHDNGNSVLFNAIKHSRDIELAQKLLDLGANPNHRNKIGQCVADIVVDACNNDQAGMQKILELFASSAFDEINQSISSTGDIGEVSSVCQKRLTLFFKTASKTTDENGDTILFHAIRYFYSLELVSTMLEQGVDINHQNNLGENAAHFAVQYLLFKGSKETQELLKLLKSRGFTGLDQKNNAGCSPLMIAFPNLAYPRIKWHEFLQFLFDEGVDFNAQNNEGFSVLFYAIRFTQSLSMIQAILDFRANPNHKTRFGGNAAHVVLLYCHHNPNMAVQVLKLLKSRGFNGFNKKDDDGLTPIILAIRFNNVLADEILQFLSEERVDFNAQDNKGHSVLFYAIQHSKNVAFIQTILDLGAEPNHENKLKRNAAHLVLYCYRNDSMMGLEVLKQLRSREFDGFNKQDVYGCTPLMHAIQFNATVEDRILQFLSEVGADFNAEDNNGQSVLFYAIQFSKDLPFIQKILNLEANPNHVDRLGKNVAHLVMSTYQNDPMAIVKVLKLLKSRGFTGLHQKANNGEYPFMDAIAFRGVLEDEVLQYLSNKGVTLDFNAQDNVGDSVLIYAIQHPANLNFIRKLLDLGAKPNYRNLKGENAAHWVISSYNKSVHEQADPNLALEILKLLESRGFELFNEMDLKGDTPLELAMKEKILNEELLAFLCDRAVE